jgi:hypothetical protein
MATRPGPAADLRLARLRAEHERQKRLAVLHVLEILDTVRGRFVAERRCPGRRRLVGPRPGWGGIGGVREAHAAAFGPAAAPPPGAPDALAPTDADDPADRTACCRRDSAPRPLVARAWCAARSPASISPTSCRARSAMRRPRARRFAVPDPPPRLRHARLELLPHLEPRWRAEIAHAVQHLGLIGALSQLAPERH